MSRKQDEKIKAINARISGECAGHEVDGPPHADALPVLGGDDTSDTDGRADYEALQETHVTTPAERTGDVIKAELLAVALRIECEQAKWDALSDELGQRAKTQHATHSPTRIGSTLYTFRLNRESKTYSLTEAKAPVEVK